jgi:zinc protease
MVPPISRSRTIRWIAASAVACALLVASTRFSVAAPATPESAPIDLAAAIPVDPDVRTGVLPNGLTWYIRNNHQPENRATLYLVVAAGSVDEDDDQKGLAHMTEHMCFNGTEQFPKQALIEYLESIGMAFGPEINAHTSLDETVYKLHVPTDNPEAIDKGLQILENWAHRVSFEAAEIDKERGVIVEEWRSGLGAQMRIWNAQMPVMYQGSKYADRMPIGDMDIIRNHEHDTIRRFYRDWYRPDLQAVIVVGDVDVNATFDSVAKLFGSIPVPAARRPRENPPLPAPSGTLASVVTDPEATQTTVRVMWHHAALLQRTLGDLRRVLVYDLASQLLNARLEELTHQAEPPFAFAGGSYGRQVRASDAFGLFAFTRETTAVRASQVLMEEAERARRFGFTPRELDRARTEFLRALENSSLEREKTESDEWTYMYVQHFLYNEPIAGPEAELALAREMLPGITMEEISAALSELMPPTGRVITMSGPRKEGLTWPTEAELCRLVDAATAQEIVPYVEEDADAPLVGSTPAAVAITSRQEDQVTGTTTWTLANGVRVVVKPTSFKNDEVVFDSYGWGGMSRVDDPAELPRVWLSSFHIGRAGVGDFDPVSLGKRLSGKIVQVSPYVSSLTEGFSGSASPRDLETLCQLIYLYATAARLEPEDFAAGQNMLNAFLANRDVDPMAAMSDTVQVRTSNRNPRSVLMTAAALAKADREASLAFHRNAFSDCDDFTFFFVGNIDLSTFEPMVCTWLGNLPTSPRVDRWIDRSWPLPKGRSEDVVTRGMAPKGNVQIVFQGEAPWSRESESALDALVSCLKIRLREVVREDMSGTYGVRVAGSFQEIPRGQYRLNVSWGCDPDREEELETAVWGVLDEFMAKGADETTLTKVRETHSREHETQLRENEFWVEELSEHDKRKSDPHAILDISSDLAKLNGAVIREAAQRFLSHENYVKVVLRPEATKP